MQVKAVQTKTLVWAAVQYLQALDLKLVDAKLLTPCMTVEFLLSSSKAFTIVTSYAIYSQLKSYSLLQQSRNILKFFCLFLCVRFFLSSCFNPVKGKRLEPTYIVFKWHYLAP